MDAELAYLGFGKLLSGNIPKEKELNELYCMASNSNLDIPGEVNDDDFRNWSKCSPLVKCLGLMESYKMLISRVDETPEISTYLIFRAATIDKKKEIGESGINALEFFLSTYGLSEFDIERYIDEDIRRN